MEKDCTFCTNPEIQARLIHKDELVMAFPTYMPITPGHTLICPIRHAANINEITEEEFLAIRNIIGKIKSSLEKAFGAKGFNIAINDGKVSGQSVSHLHVHIVPRTKGDKGVYNYEPREFLYRPGIRNITPEQELQEITRLIKENIIF